jgi:V/A-type H+/Na+-transporting ATPase subunit E
LKNIQGYKKLRELLILRVLMKETGKQKVKKICEILRQETLEPAKKEAEEIVEKAKARAEMIRNEAHLATDQMMQEVREGIERERGVFQSSLNQACKQALEALKQKIEAKLFNGELSRLVLEQTRDPKVLAGWITAVTKALEKEGVDADLTAYISAAVPAHAVNVLLAKEIIEKLREKSVLLSPIGGGIEVKVHQERITIDMSDETLKELLASYLRKDFRAMLFEPNIPNVIQKSDLG